MEIHYARIIITIKTIMELIIIIVILVTTFNYFIINY